MNIHIIRTQAVVTFCDIERIKRIGIVLALWRGSYGYPIM